MRIDNAVNDYTYMQNKPASPQTNTEKVEVRPEVTLPIVHKVQPNEGTQISLDQKKADAEHEVIKAIEKANKHFAMYDRRLEFSIHDATKQIIVKVIDTENDAIIREIPSEKILDMVAHLWEVAGILVDEKR